MSVLKKLSQVKRSNVGMGDKDQVFVDDFVDIVVGNKVAARSAVILDIDEAKQKAYVRMPDKTKKWFNKDCIRLP